MRTLKIASLLAIALTAAIGVSACEKEKAPDFAWHVSFLKGTTYPGNKTDVSFVRAVRGGRV